MSKPNLHSLSNPDHASADHDHADHDHADHQHDQGVKADSSHGHSHSHNLSPDAITGAFKIGLVITVVFVVVEFAAGIWANSLALISDAGHNLTDALALAFSWWAIRLAGRAPDFNKTYGYHRAGILAATLNAVSLVLIAIYIFYEGLQRLVNPPPVEGWTVAGIASIALLINLIIAGMLYAGSKHDLNSRSAFIHIAGDAAASVGVIVAGLVEVTTGWRLADPLISMGIGLLILWSSWGIIKEATNILLEGIPDGLDMVSLMRDLMRDPAVKDVHDLHVWTIGSGFLVLSSHLQLAENCTLQEANQVSQTLSTMLKTRYNIGHATLQLECQSCEMTEVYCAPTSTSTGQQSIIKN